ncbi:hypothetical protein [Poritiphilus flavus]|uniref:Uncharacterized protein n=1 Tax=Poritiphilus flavus TaxID=2697053 RepID=A0A6L9E9R8_9FLAO|nr:hypothetical protein [Poritiphilus flavus]NAS11321.1 hypothetical protein [Poritiphilus flavus]
MKTLITLIFVLFIGMVAQAQNNTAEAKVEVIEMSIVTETVEEETKEAKETQVARLYKRKNSRVKKALSFSTKRTRAKLA